MASRGLGGGGWRTRGAATCPWVTLCGGDDRFCLLLDPSHAPRRNVGYCAMFEGNPPTQQLIDRFTLRSDLPDATFSTLRHHTNIDGDHSAEINDLLDSYR